MIRFYGDQLPAGMSAYQADWMVDEEGQWLSDEDGGHAGSGLQLSESEKNEYRDVFKGEDLDNMIEVFLLLFLHLRV